MRSPSNPERHDAGGFPRLVVALVLARRIWAVVVTGPDADLSDSPGGESSPCGLFGDAVSQFRGMVGSQSFESRHRLIVAQDAVQVAREADGRRATTRPLGGGR